VIARTKTSERHLILISAPATQRRIFSLAAAATRC
jgi:hypothetical protein